VGRAERGGKKGAAGKNSFHRGLGSFALAAASDMDLFG
jgi:hypothetical protein